MCCSLIKTGQQFEKQGCDNCPFLNLEQDQERVLERTTTQFNGYGAAETAGRGRAGRAWAKHVSTAGKQGREAEMVVWWSSVIAVVWRGCECYDGRWFSNESFMRAAG